MKHAADITQRTDNQDHVPLLHSEFPFRKTVNYNESTNDQCSTPRLPTTMSQIIYIINALLKVPAVHTKLGCSSSFDATLIMV